jgi:CubicO group peptidase (beta-lactamase class C family)
MFLDRLSELYDATIENVHGVVPPGSRCDYSPLANHVLMGTALVRTDPKGRNYQTLLHEDLFAPLKMDSTSMGLRADLKDRHVRPDMRGTVPIKHLSRNIEGDHALFEDPDVEAPHVGCASTASDLWRFAEMLRREGELDGVRILSPATIRLARQVHTGTMPNELYKGVAERAGWEVPPANMGLGFQVRGTGVFHHLFGTLATPETFGNYGAGSTLFWIDPERDVSFACLTAGVMTQAANIERFQKLSDLVHSAMV